MRGPLVLVALFVLAGALSAGAQPKYVERAGTVVLVEGRQPVLKSNGNTYDLEFPDPSVASLPWKSGMAIIVKGEVTVVSEPGKPKVRTLRPTEVVIRGRSFLFAPDP
jgi:hypothetical protein